MSRPCLKRRCISTNCREIAIMQPIQNLLLLTESSIPQTVFSIHTTSMSKSQLRSRFRIFGIMSFFPASPHKQNISNLDISALRSGPNINTLIFPTLIKLLPRNRIIVIRIIINPLLMRIPAIIKKNPSSRNPMLRPVMNRALVISIRPNDIRALCAVVKRSSADVGKVSESVPLGSALRV